VESASAFQRYEEAAALYALIHTVEEMGEKQKMATAEGDDTDIFAGSSGGSVSNPNVLIIIDNTSNWSAANQQWPGGVKQGQAELLAMKTVIGNLGGGTTVDAAVNVGLMMFTDSGNGRGGGYVRYATRPMTVANKVTFQNLLQTIYNNFQAPSEKVASSATYGEPLFDAFKYFGGFTTPAHATDDTASTPQDATHFGPIVFDQRQTYNGNADAAGYTSAGLTTFSPIANDSCSRNFIVFIGNGSRMPTITHT
jgi:type IV pilus assembly protein PilY1